MPSDPPVFTPAESDTTRSSGASSSFPGTTGYTAPTGATGSAGTAAFGSTGAASAAGTGDGARSSSWQGDRGSSGSNAAAGSSSGASRRSSWRRASADGERPGSGRSALPSITTMIRTDHAHVLANFHRFRPNLSTVRQQAIADAICMALEVHAQLEEEIFYPALKDVAGDDPVLKDARPEHDEMRRLIAELRGCEPGEPRFRETLNQLMRDVMHHVADEETVLLPLAETRLADRLGELGTQMTRRRIALVAPHTLQMAKNQALATPFATIAALGAVAGGAWLLASSMGSSRR